MTADDRWPVRVRPERDVPEGGFRTINFKPSDEEGTYGNVRVQCPCCGYDWDENAQHVERECAKALDKDEQEEKETP
jgi:hypothetical protein